MPPDPALPLTGYALFNRSAVKSGIQPGAPSHPASGPAAECPGVMPHGGILTMRLWSLHPDHLDSKGLVAAWREGLLARAVLRGETVGYRHHPQLERFRSHPAPLSAINFYLRVLYEEASRRGYKFDRAKFGPVRNQTNLRVTSGQLHFELRHLSAKVRRRSPAEMHRLPRAKDVRSHPLFRIISGPPETWERGAA